MKRKRATKSKEEAEESRDKLILDDIEEQRLKQAIRVFLGATDSKLNQSVEMKADHFFTKKENRINFNEDVYIVPLLMCKLSKYPVTKANQIEYFNIKNNISPGILRYLYSLRVCIQREKDENERTMIRRQTKLASVKKQKTRQQLEENDANTIQHNNKGHENHYNNSSSSSFHQLEAKSDYLRNLKAISPIQGINIYEIEDFFIHKYIRYENIRFASDREKDFVLNKASSLAFEKYKSRHIPKVIASLN